MKKSFLRKIFTVISALAILTQSLTPYLVLLPQQAYAQTATPDATTVTPTPTNTVTPTATPTPPDTLTPTPTATPTPTDTVTPTATPSATGTVTPTPTPVDNLSPPPSSTPADNPSAGSGQVQGVQTSITPSPTATSTPTPASNAANTTPATGNEQVNLVILKNVSAPAIDLSATVSQGSAVLTTNKPDYSPTDTALITGKNFNPGETYTLLITSINNYSFSTTVTADSSGNIAYAYQLDGTYRPTYTVQAIDSTGKVVATTTFTDSVPFSSQTVTGACMTTDQHGKLLTQGNTCTANDTSLSEASAPTIIGDGATYNDALNSSNGNGCKYPGDYVKFTTNWQLATNATQRYNLGLWFATAGQTNVTDGGQCSITSLPSHPDPFFESGSDTCGDIKSTGTGNLTVTMVAVCNPDNNGLLKLPYCTSWSQNDGVCTGPTQTLPDNGSKCSCNSGFTIPIEIPPSIEVVKKLVPSDDSGLFNLLVNSVTKKTDATNGGTTGKVGITTGSNSFGEAHGTGTDLNNYTSAASCVLRGTQTSVSTSGSNPWTLSVSNGQDIVCTITNTRINNGSITIVKDAQPNNAQSFGFTTTGGLTPSTFSLVDNGGTNSTTYSNLAAGSYSISENATTGWTLASVSCTDNTTHNSVSTPSGNGTGTIALAAGQNVTCVFTNTKQPKLTVHKVVINHGGNKVAVDFGPYKVDGNTVTLDVANTYSIGSHTVTETPNSNYTATFSGACDANGNVSLAAGDDKTCTITNEEKAAKVVVHKIVINHGLSFDSSHFAPYKVGTTTVTLDAETTMNSGSYVISENADSSYNATFTAGDCDAQGNITLVAGQTKSCTITNEEKSTHLKVTKVVINHGSNKVVSDFPLFIDGNSVTSGANNLVNSGSHTVSETSNSNYTATITGDCNAQGQVTLASGANGICTITNEEKLSDITVHKVVINHGGNKTTADFGPYKVDSTTVTLDQATTFDSGNHTVTETPLSTYTVTFSGGCDLNGVVTLGSGDHKTCTITNEEKPAKLIITKVVINDNGGKKQISDFPLFVGANGVTSGATNTFNSGAYVVSETSDPNYTGTFTAGDCDANGNVTLVPGQTKSCTITNDDNASSLVLNKVVNNTNGGTAIPADWTLTATGPTTISGPGPILSSGANFNAGTYTLSESGPSGYSASSWSCTGDVTNTGNQITLGLGQSATCVITNSDIAPTLKLIKNVTNDNGGTATPANWDLSATGSSNSFTDAGNSTTFHSVTANVTYTLSETGPSGYSAGNWSCNGGTLQGDQLTLGLYQNVTCTITNDDNTPSLTLVKVVDNKHGGTAVADDWTLTADGPTPISGAGGATSDSGFEAGTYTLSESTGPSGYIASSWKCVGGTQDGNKITLALGESARCTITNSDIAPQLTVIKHVVGGTNVAGDFTMNVTGTNVLSNSSFPGSETGTTVTLNQGSYSVSETGSSGYTESESADCSGKISVGETKSCTITNTRDQGTIQVVKVVDPHDNGATTWNFEIAGPTNNNANGLKDGSSSNVFTSDTGSYVVTETGANLSDYNTSYSCVDQEETVVDSGSGTEARFSLDTNQNILCTFTNTLKRGSITVEKTTNPEETGQSFGFALGGGASDSTSLKDGGSDTFESLLPGNYTLTETPTKGWDLTNANCTSSQNRSLSYNGNDNTAITLHPDENVTCSFTNTERGHIIVDKVTDPSQDPQSFTFTTTGIGYTGFSLTDQATPNDQELVPGEYSVSEGAVPGWEQTSATCDNEQTPGHINLAAGQTVHCVFTNTKLGKVIVTKYLDDNANGKNDDEQVLGGWDININNGDSYDRTKTTDNTAGQVTFDDLLPGDYTLSENLESQPGWNLSNISCTGDEGIDTSNEHSVTVNAGDVINCSIGNYKNANITVAKVLYQPDGKTVATNDATQFNFNVTNNNDVNNSFPLQNGGSQAYDVKPGTYDISEFTPNQNYSFLNCKAVYGNQSIGSPIAGGEKVSLGSNDSVTVTCYNAQQYGHITGDKFNDIIGEGQECSFNPENQLNPLSCQPKLPNWTIQLFQNDGGDLGTKVSETTTDINGNYSFDKVVPGSYFVCELPQNGWQQTYPNDTDFFEGHGECYRVNVTSGFNTERQFNFGNHNLTPKLTISKSNDASGNKAPGDTVTFTIVINDDPKAGPADNVKVTDLLPKGFHYNSGSWGASSSIHGVLSLSEPTYASPGVWTIGHMDPGEVVTLKYKVTIDSGQATGTYFDNAWGVGNPVGSSTQVFALAVDPGNLDSSNPDNNFVGTQISVVNGSQPGVNYKATSTKEVLGASTGPELPATGEPTLWVIIAALLSIFGFGSLILGVKLRRKYE